MKHGHNRYCLEKNKNTQIMNTEYDFSDSPDWEKNMKQTKPFLARLGNSPVQQFRAGG